MKDMDEVMKSSERIGLEEKQNQRRVSDFSLL